MVFEGRLPKSGFHLSLPLVEKPPAGGFVLNTREALLELAQSPVEAHEGQSLDREVPLFSGVLGHLRSVSAGSEIVNRRVSSSCNPRA